MHPETRAVHAQADPGQQRHEEEPDRAEPEEILVVLQQAVIATKPEQCEREYGDADHDPRRLPERVARTEPVDLRQPDRGERPEP